jgi:hypothetical protein
MTACVTQPVKSTPSIKYIPCEVLSPIHIRKGIDKETEKEIIDFDVAYDKNCL